MVGMRFDADANRELRLEVHSERLDGGQLNLNLTNEGLIIDALDENGDVVGTHSMMWDELKEDLL